MNYLFLSRWLLDIRKVSVEIYLWRSLCKIFQVRLLMGYWVKCGLFDGVRPKRSLPTGGASQEEMDEAGQFLVDSLLVMGFSKEKA